MPEPFVITIGIAGIILIGLAFTAINLVKDAGRLIAMGLLAFLLVVLLNRTMSSSGNLTDPSSNSPNASNSPNFPNISASPIYPSSPNPSAAPVFPNTSPTNPSSPNTSPTQSPPAPFNFDSASKSISDFAKSISKGLDEFVYGNPYAVEPDSDQQSEGQRLEPDSSQTSAVPSEQQGYQISPDGVPSRVSTLVRPDASTGVSRSTSGADTRAADTRAADTRAADTRATVSRPVSAWW